MAETSALREPSGECCFNMEAKADCDVVMHASSGPYRDLSCSRAHTTFGQVWSGLADHMTGWLSTEVCHKSQCH